MCICIKATLAMECMTRIIRYVYIYKNHTANFLYSFFTIILYIGKINYKKIEKK